MQLFVLKKRLGSDEELRVQDPICSGEDGFDPVADIEEIPTFKFLKMHISILP
jgi:hypothetical protein